MLYIVFTTGQCNLKCVYCGGGFPNEVVPWEVNYTVDSLKHFISDDPDPTIAFYGGEPLLNPHFIEEILEEIPNAKFTIQTNGLLCKRLGWKFWNKFNAILLSIDGTEEVTDHYRGINVYERVIKNAEWLRSIGFHNDLIARMTVSEQSDIYRDVTHLISLNLFDHIHWQLDVIWSSRWKDFDGWCERSYMPGISRLIQLWIREAKWGRILGIIPFISIMGRMIKNEEISCPPCGAGLDSVSILTNGDILACPIAVDANWANLGNVSRTSRKEVVGRVKIGDPCNTCMYLKYCGGRCLYTHMERCWGESGFEKTCRLTINLIDKLNEIKHEILKLVENKISLEQIYYPTFNNTTELIP